ncbi:MAG: hypothetical protein AAF721_08165, partial [Myxococcota bacterium]
QAAVTIEWQRRLEVGDALVCRDGTRLVVAALEDGDHDVRSRALATAESTELAKVECARDRMVTADPGDVLRGVSDGTRISLGFVRRAQRAEAVITRAQLGRLCQGGAPWAAWEVRALMESPTFRGRADEALRRGNYPVPARDSSLRDERQGASETEDPSDRLAAFFSKPSALVDDPESARGMTTDRLRAIDRGLRGLAFDVDIMRNDVVVRLMTASDVETLSHGEILNAATYDPASRRTIAGGLFCQEIFGPVDSMRCACRKYEGLRHRGVECEECGVEVTGAHARHHRFAHIRLAAPVPHPWFIRQIAALLGKDVALIDAVARATKTLDGAAPQRVDETGGQALYDALTAIELPAVAAGGGEAAAVADLLQRRGLAATDLMLTVLPVLPAGMRPLSTPPQPPPGGAVVQARPRPDTLPDAERASRAWALIETLDSSDTALEIKCYADADPMVDLDIMVRSQRLQDADSLDIEHWRVDGSEDYRPWFEALQRHAAPRLRSLRIGRHDAYGAVGTVAPLLARLDALEQLTIGADLSELQPLRSASLVHLGLRGTWTHEAMRRICRDSTLEGLRSIEFDVASDEADISDVVDLLTRYRVQEVTLGEATLSRSLIARLAELPRHGLRRRPSVRSLDLSGCCWPDEDEGEGSLLDAFRTHAKALRTIEIQLPEDAEDSLDELRAAGLQVS